MDGLIGQTDGAIRLAIFLSVFLVMALIELGWPKRALHASKRRRWLTNVGISVTGSIVLRLMAMLVVPIAAVAAALYVEQHQIGLLNHVAWPVWISGAAAAAVPSNRPAKPASMRASSASDLKFASTASQAE